MSDRVVKTMKGAPVPEGWSVVKTTRTTQYIQKNQAAPVPQEEFDDLLAAFGKFGISAQVVQASDVAMDTSGGSTRARLPSLPTRRGQRSSSSSKRRYTHRQRASRTGTGGYRPTKFGRKA